MSLQMLYAKLTFYLKNIERLRQLMRETLRDKGVEIEAYKNTFYVYKKFYFKNKSNFELP